MRYNSKLPVVVFVPEGMGLRWRVWSAGAMQDASAR
ncbi:MAG TPA: ecotin family protein [Ottowia sp.]|nr:ecotin family protein [Ottowia sp.]